MVSGIQRAVAQRNKPIPNMLQPALIRFSLYHIDERLRDKYFVIDFATLVELNVFYLYKNLYHRTKDSLQWLIQFCPFAQLQASCHISMKLFYDVGIFLFSER